MKSSDILLALAVVTAWGFNFTVIGLALGSFPPLLLAALRFALAALPALVVARPEVGWPALVGIAVPLFVGQFGFLFSAMAHGLPAGVASIMLQSQAFLTIGLGAIALGERPRASQVAGSLLALGGLVVLAGPAFGSSLPLVSVALCMAAAMCWAVGNVLLRRLGPTDMFALTAWMSLVPPLPFLVLSALLEGPARMAHAMSAVGWPGVAALAYLSVVSTSLGYGGWGRLMRRYPAGTVAPFSLLVPVSGMGCAALVLGEGLDGVGIVGALLLLAGMVLAAVPLRPGRLGSAQCIQGGRAAGAE